MKLAEQLAREITNLADLGKNDLARLRSNDLYDHTVVILTRWDNDLSADSKNNCLTAKSLLDSVRTLVTKTNARGGELTARQSLQIQGACRQIQEVFVAECASIMRRNDEGSNA
jgi:hypothetical protein